MSLPLTAELVRAFQATHGKDRLPHLRVLPAGQLALQQGNGVLGQTLKGNSSYTAKGLDPFKNINLHPSASLSVCFFRQWRHSFDGRYERKARTQHMHFPSCISAAQISSHEFSKGFIPPFPQEAPQWALHSSWFWIHETH